LWSTSGRWGYRERGEQAGGEVLGPGPGFRDADLAFALAVDDAGRGVQQAVAKVWVWLLASGRPGTAAAASTAGRDKRPEMLVSFDRTRVTAA
jgi:hypothetical protein